MSMGKWKRIIYNKRERSVQREINQNGKGVDHNMMYNPQLETFISVVEAGSFSKAADKHLTGVRTAMTCSLL